MGRCSGGSRAAARRLGPIGSPTGMSPGSSNARRWPRGCGAIFRKPSDGEKFSGHSLRAGLATAAQADERYVQKQLGHASAEMTRRYQRQRDRFRVNLTKAAGL